VQLRKVIAIVATISGQQFGGPRDSQGSHCGFWPVAVTRGMHPLLVRTRALAWIGLGLLSGLGVPVGLEAAGVAPVGTGADPAALEAKVRPLLERRCFECHSHAADRIRGGFVLDSRSGLLQGGESGKPAVVAGNPSVSPLLERVGARDPKHRMPPEGEPLGPAEVALLEAWIRQGAPWSAASEAAPGLARRPRGPITDQDRAWWAFQPPAPVAVPAVRDSGWALNEVDRFILSALEARGLTPTPGAERGVLIRRLCFDLWGLPPEPADVDAFVSDQRPDAYERLVDRLLDSPRYGERWARHWLDLVRYADSDGYKADDLRPTAWRYRDYVIDALNRDKPYDRFVREQLAGDELYPDDPESMAATGYLRCGIYEYNNRDVAGQWTTLLNDITDTTGDVFLGLGFQCARCHDHKFDPILRKDYYRLQASFAGIQWHDDLPLATAATRAAREAQAREWEDRTASLRREIETVVAPYKARATEGAITKFPPPIQAILRKPESERSPLERQWGALAHRQVAYEHERLVAQLKPDDKERHGTLQRALSEYDALKPAPLPVALTVREVGPVAPEVFVPGHPEEPIAPGVPTVLESGPGAGVRPAGESLNPGRRSALANWLTRPDHPLTSRVLVNRVWQHHFGRGLVGTGNDLGRLGDRPSHPELLDWLARRFVGGGWSLKSLHRLLLTSATYRQASSPSTIDPEHRRGGRSAGDLAAAWRRGEGLDPANRLLWRRQARRLDAEQIRDAMLQATGELRTDASRGAADGSQFRRSIRSKVLRNTRDPLLEVFDAPQQFTSTASRDATTTPIQSLLLINSPFMLQRSRAMAARLEVAAPGRPEDAVVLAHRLTLGRRPSPEELEESLGFLREQQRRVDPELALSAAAGFQSERMPFRDGRAAVFAPRSPQETLSALLGPMLPQGPMTLEAFVYLRSLPEDGAPRTIASLADASGSALELGVSGRKSSRRAQSLMLRVVRAAPATVAGSGAGPAVAPVSAASAASVPMPAVEEIASDLVLHMDKPYYVGISIAPGSGRGPAVTFHLKDLSNDEEPLQTVPAQAAGEMPLVQPSRAAIDPVLTLGGRRGGQALWDGLIDDVRLTGSVLPADRLAWVQEGPLPGVVGLWCFEAKPSRFSDTSGRGRDLTPARRSLQGASDARFLAMADLCHALLNSNGFLFVE